MAMATSGENDAEFTAWYGREFSRIAASLALSTGHHDLAEDATSEAFARALADWPRVSSMTSPTAWVYTVALNQVRTGLRRTVLERRYASRDRAPVADGPEPPADNVWRAVAALPERQRIAIALRYVLDLPEAEIATVMNVRRGTVAATLHAARARLADLLSPMHEGDLL
jgi:RNA polymerase sigma-70 factor (ECF subfamily)